jgi:competence protein ComEC
MYFRKSVPVLFVILLCGLLLNQCSKEITSPGNLAPIISNFPAPITRVGAPFPDIQLDNYVQDEDPDSLILWTINPGSHVSSSINHRILQLVPVDSIWIGEDILTLHATDTQGLTSSKSFTCYIVNPDQWEQHNSDGTVTIIWHTTSISLGEVKFGSSPNQLRTESTSLLNADTLHQVRLLGIPSNQITYYQAFTKDGFGNILFESPVDSFIVALIQPNDVFRVTMIDVRQGDSFLLQTPSGQIIVIDGGYGTHQPSFGGAWSGDGYPFALNYMQNEGINQVDYIIETHHDMDHWGGLHDIQNAMPVSHYYSPDSPGPLIAGQPWDLGDSLLNVTVLSIDYPPGVSHEGDNNRSIVLRFAIHQISFLFTGDAEQPVELWEAATYGSELHSTVLKVGHHGSYSSSNPSFINLVSPEIALISCGAGNPYGHPHSETLQTLDNVGAQIYRTDLDGDVTFRTDGQMTLEITR